jgi:hypothetical protein
MMTEDIELPDDVRAACERTVENDAALAPVAEILLEMDAEDGNSGS